ncbi:MAG: RNA-guided pseudouridylation complex pseudouridine synthase subunit Cbf5 [Thermoprotei archaeon]
MSGILPIGLGKGTKLVKVLSNSGKEYVCLARLHGDVDENEIRKVINLFKGKIYQRPPVRSSVKRILRTRTIYSIDILEIKERNVLLRVKCEAGTYMRKLCYDIGEILGVGAHMDELRRTGVGHFNENDERLVTLHEVLGAYTLWKEQKYEDELRRVVRPMEEIVTNFPPIIIRDSAVDAIAHGASLAAPGILTISSKINRDSVTALYTKKGELVAIAKALYSAKEIVEMESGLVAKPLRIFMEAGKYPSWKSD